MSEATNNMVPKTAPEIIGRIKELTKQVRRNAAELARFNIELGALFIRLKERSSGTWLKKLERIGYSQRVVSRVMKAAKVLAAPDGTVDAKLLERLPGDPIKLETICALPRPEIERLIKDH